jgi:anion-transporting  ArsA/GET3 family ATPase
MDSNLSSKRLLFVLGKGGTGRTMLSTSLGYSFASKNKKTLIVQWAAQDHISPLFQKKDAGHNEVEVAPNLYTMNFSLSETIREYFVDHLKFKLLYNLVVQNTHVKKFIQAAPGISELFFLGRLYWLVDLALKERGWQYDHIIVDEPAMGHGTALFTIAETVASFGITGPLARECKRITRLLKDEKKTGILISCLPEELPVEETQEFFPIITKHLKREPLGVFMNRSISPFFKNPKPKWLGGLKEEVKDTSHLDLFLNMLLKRHDYEEAFAHWLQDYSPKTFLMPVPDITLQGDVTDPLVIVKDLSHIFNPLI